jgi:hypothetical protein
MRVTTMGDNGFATIVPPGADLGGTIMRATPADAPAFFDTPRDRR